MVFVIINIPKAKSRKTEMSLSPVTFQAMKPTFKAQPQGGNQGVIPAGVSLADLQTKQPQYMQTYKPGFIAKVRAFFTKIGEVSKGAIVGLCYGAAAGLPAAGVAGFMAKSGQAVSATQLGKFVFGAAALGGLLSGAFVGKQKVSESIKGAGVGLAYGAAAGIPAAIAAIALKGKGAAPAAKGALIAAAAMTTVIGAWVGKLIANGKVANIYMQHGAVNNIVGKQ